jgi:hypothetical protein
MSDTPTPLLPRHLVLVKDDEHVGDDLVIEGKLLEPMVADPDALPDLNARQQNVFRLLTPADKHAIRTALTTIRMTIHAAVICDDEALAQQMFRLARTTRETVVEATLGEPDR